MSRPRHYAAHDTERCRASAGVLALVKRGGGIGQAGFEDRIVVDTKLRGDEKRMGTEPGKALEESNQQELPQ